MTILTDASDGGGAVARTVQANMSPIRILAIIVLYRMTAEESNSYQSLLHAAGDVPAEMLDLKVILYDNTPDSASPVPLPPGVEYHKALRNKGLAEAYNFAIEVAEDGTYEWLLTLDQDTVLPRKYLSRMVTLATSVKNTPSIAAIVPQITSGDRLLSPYWFWHGAVPRWFRKGYAGIPSLPTFAFNSASLIRFSALRQIGGYHPLFWLDNSDTYMFRRLHQHGKSVYVEGDLQVGHDFSMLSFEKSMSPERYRNVVSTESAFWDLEMNWIAGLERTLRLVVRYLRQLKSGSKTYRVITGKFLGRRLFWTRHRRISIWQKETTRQLCSSPLPERSYDISHPPLPAKAKLSVCMAAYNGEKYIEMQLNSILSQLGSDDEVIIVEDKSTDQSLFRIQSIEDPRIRLIQHERNLGVIATFEDAMRNATGDLIFLADDDDIWAANKVEKMVKEFRKSDSIQVVTSAVSLIDQEGNAIYDPIYSNQVKFRPGFWKNILVNRYQGSAMAFRSTLLAHILPLPNSKWFFHDVWIGTSNERIGGRVAYIDEPLLLYRRHSHNISIQMSFANRIKSRAQLLLEHVHAILDGRR